jgi:hypothetical protein
MSIYSKAYARLDGMAEALVNWSRLKGQWIKATIVSGIPGKFGIPGLPGFIRQSGIHIRPSSVSDSGGSRRA